MEPITAAILASTATAAATGMASGMVQANSSKKLMNRQYELNRKWEIERATHAHQWEVSDLEAAGLNPILSAGGQGAITSGLNVAQPDLSGYANAAKALSENVNNASDYYINQQNANANQQNANTNTEIGQSEITLNQQKAANLAEEQPYIKGINSAETAKRFAEASEINSKVAVNKANVNLMNSQAELNDAKNISEIIKRSNLNSATALNRKKAQLMGTIKGGKILGVNFDRY